MNGTIRVGTLFGIPFGIHPSWFLVLGLMTFSYSTWISSQFPSLGAGVPLLLGLAAALMLFASVLAHELGHSLVARSQGVEVKSINLFLFGGLASLDRESKTPGGAFAIAIAGPLVSFALFGLLTLAAIVLPLAGPAAALVQLLAYLNLALGLFNLIPGLPLDGGNVLKAAVWKLTGNPYRGVTFASRVGQVLGWAAIAIGLLPLLSGSAPNFWTALIGWFLLQNAGRSAQSARVQEALDGLTAADAVIGESPVVPINLSLREFANEYVIGKRPWEQFYAVDESGHPVGKLSVNDLKNVPTHQWPLVPVSDLVEPTELENSVEAGRSLLDVVMMLERESARVLPVVDANGALVGLLEKSSVLQLLQRRSSGGDPAAKAA